MKILPLIALMVLLSLFGCNVVEHTGKLNFNDNWKFIIEDEIVIQNNAFYQSDYDDSYWKSISLPHTANIEPLLVNDQWQGVCWYRKSFFVPDIYKEKEVWVEFEAAMNHSVVWLNGIKVSENNGGYLPVVINVTDFIEPGKQNVIAVRLNNEDNPVTGPKPLKILDFNMYGGLYRNAWLILKNKVHISHPALAQKEAGGGVFITTPVVDEKQSLVQVKTHVVNKALKPQSIQIVNELFFDGHLIQKQTSENLTIAASGEIEDVQTIDVSQARLWSPDSPNLYNVKTTVLADNSVVDYQDTRFGIRSFEFIDNQLYINGKKTFLRGVNRHQEYPFVGYALSDNAQYRDAWKIKEAGFDFVRLSHYPHSTAFMDACDELGLVTLPAILGWQYYWDHDAFRAYVYRSANHLIYRDRNHASVLAWEVSLNETRMPMYFMQELHDIAQRQYPGDHTYSAGWQSDVYDVYLQARQHRILHYYDSIQSKPYLVSEYGDWEYFAMTAGLNQHEYTRQLRYEMSSRQRRGYGEDRLLQQVVNVQEAHNDNLNTPTFADAYWVMYDYNRGYDDKIEHSGVMGIFRLPKFLTHFFKSQRNIQKDTTLFIASYWNKDSPLDVKVFSNCDEVALYLNDELIEIRQPDTDSISNNLKHPPFTFNIDAFRPGVLRAEGFSEGELITEFEVKTPEEPASLKLWIDKSNREPKARCNDVLFIYIAGVDDHGTIVPGFTENIELLIKGDAEIMNIGEIEAEAGIATALVRIGKSSGVVSLEATSDKGLNGSLGFRVAK